MRKAGINIYIQMSQTPGKWKHTYKVKVDGVEYIIEVSRRLGFRARKIMVYDNQRDEIAQVDEMSRSTAFFEKIPIINWFIKVNFMIWKRGKLAGEIRVKNSLIQDKLTLKSDKHDLKAYYHTGGRKEDKVSIFDAGAQTGRITKSKKVRSGCRSYTGEYDIGTDPISAMIIMCIADFLWNNSEVAVSETIHRSGAESYWGWDMIFGKKHDEKWKPNGTTSR